MHGFLKIRRIWFAFKDYELDFEDEDNENNFNDNESYKSTDQESLQHSSTANTPVQVEPIRKASVEKHETKQQAYRFVDKSTDEKVIKAHKHIKIPTDNIVTYSTKVYYNSDSADRQQMRAKDLRKLIEFDTKGFCLLDFDPKEMGTVYSHNIKHVSVSMVGLLHILQTRLKQIRVF
jgi:hypothetical protein